MSELIPPTPETESEERRLWDSILRCFEKLSEMSDEVDLFWTLDNLRDEDLQAGFDELYGTYVMALIPEGESSDLSEVEAFLREQGLLEEDDEV